MKYYCAYCGRVAHRCACAEENSRARQWFARSPHEFAPHWMTAPYKRGVPPQIKRRERYTLRKHYDDWYAQLVVDFGEQCANCGLVPDDDTTLVIDHVISIAKGGVSDYANLQLLCAECNRIKGKLCIDCRPSLSPYS